MTTKIIAENILQPEHFISATDQAGGFIGQPIPDGNNAGNFTLLSSGNIADTVYSGTATGDGAGGGTTVVDALLAAYGDDFWIGATIEITSGAYDGETATITDFAQATGTLTFAALSGQIVSGVTFTLTLSFASREFEVELVSSGDPGAATFKWSHDGGTTFFGRNAPFQATWLNETEIANDQAAANFRSPVYVDTDGTIYVAYNKSSSLAQIIKSVDSGKTWAEVSSYSSTNYGTPMEIARLSSGRLLLGTYSKLIYSDDNFTTLIVMVQNIQAHALRVVDNDVVISAGTPITNDRVTFAVSNDGGNTFSDREVVAYDSGYVSAKPSVCANANGEYVVAYSTNIDGGGTYEIKCKIYRSGAWTSPVDVMDYDSAQLTEPCVWMDWSGTLYCSAVNTNGQNIFLSQSVDNGDTWTDATFIAVHDDATKDIYWPSFATAPNGTIYCVFSDVTAGAVVMLSRGMPEAFSSNAVPIPISEAAVVIVNNISIEFLGGSGIVGDKWTFTPQYSWAMSNIISGSPSKPFRSTVDSIDCAIVIDLGQYNRHRATGIGLFGCNVRTLKFQMNASDVWTSPSVDETISFDVAPGTVDAVSGNMVQDTAFLANYKDHHFSNKGKPERYFLRATSGIDDGETWEILDNVDGWFILNTEDSQSMAASDTFAVFTSSMSDTFTGGNYRFLRVLIETQTTADGFYQIGSMVAGMAKDLTKSWRVGFGKNHAYNIDLMATHAGGLIPIKKSNRRRVFTVRWDADLDTRQEVVALADTMEGRSLCLIPNTSTPGDCYLVKFSGDINHTHRFSTDRFDITVTFQEVI